MYENNSSDLENIYEEDISVAKLRKYLQKTIFYQCSLENIDIVRLSKKLMLKHFIAFTNIQVTRFYNSAEVKDNLIKYLESNGLIQSVNDLFLSMAATRKVFRSESGFIKLFPKTRAAQEAAEIDLKLREKVNISLDTYLTTVSSPLILTTFSIQIITDGYSIENGTRSCNPDV